MLLIERIQSILKETPPDLWQDVYAADKQIESAMAHLRASRPEAAIELLESIRDVDLSNEHYTIKRAIALHCAYHAVGNGKASQDALKRAMSITLPPVAWEVEDWWGDAKSLMNKYRPGKSYN